MAPDPPVDRVVLGAASVADDLGYVALADLASALGESTYRVIGGHMVTALVARWQLGAELYRETGDTDLGVPPVVVREDGIIERLRTLGYEKVAGNRFARVLDDVPVTVGEGTPERRAVIDVLVPAYTSRIRNNHRVSDDLVTTEVPGLATALQRDPVALQLDMVRLNGVRLDERIAFPDEVSALVLKAHATAVRRKDTDVVDVWRCLEVNLAADTRPDSFTSADCARAADVVRQLFQHRDGAGMNALLAEQRLSTEAADQRYTRIQALIDRVLGRP